MGNGAPLVVADFEEPLSGVLLTTRAPLPRGGGSPPVVARSGEHR